MPELTKTIAGALSTPDKLVMAGGRELVLYMCRDSTFFKRVDFGVFR